MHVDHPHIKSRCPVGKKRVIRSDLTSEVAKHLRNQRRWQVKLRDNALDSAETPTNTNFHFMFLELGTLLFKSRNGNTMGQLFPMPELPMYVQQLASILPLTALIEFIDLPTKLHGFHLTGRVPLWNWPITPAGARLLLQTKDNEESCCLDSFDRSTVLHCIDGRFGDSYPCSTPTTTRLWLGSLKPSHSIHNPHRRMLKDNIRRQTLELILISRNEELVPSVTTNPKRGWFWSRWLHPAPYKLLSLTGWLLWTATAIISFSAALYVAGAFLILLPLSGLAIKYGHGGKPRQLLDQASQHYRTVVATNSFNANNWWQFYGRSGIVNSLLNKPLIRKGHVEQRFIIVALQLLIMGQWALAVGSCAMQDWNAIIISLWLAFCAFSSAYIYPARQGVRDWLELDCNLHVKKITATLSSRRSLLGAIVYLNPDTYAKTDSMNWINPILAPCEERTKWEAALLRYIKDGSKFISVPTVRRTLLTETPPEAIEESSEPREYWVDFIEEGVDMGRRIEKEMQEFQRTNTIKPEG